MIRSMTFVVLASLSMTAVAAEPISAPAETGDMKVIFNGVDLTGWDGDPRLWSVKDGVIHGETTPEKGTDSNTFLIWKDGVLKDFELRLSVKCGAANNSGIQYRSKHVPFGSHPQVKSNWAVIGYQYEVRNSVTSPHLTGFLYHEGNKRGPACLVGEKAVWESNGKKVVDELITKEEYAKLFKLDDWNDFVIVARGDHMQHYVNGRLVIDFTDSPELLLSEGILALQLHVGKPMWVEFKNLRLKSLD